MAKVSARILSQIKNLSKPELEKLILKAASGDKAFHDYLLVNYFDKEFAEQDLFEQAKKDLDILFRKSYRGRAEEEKLTNMMIQCTKRINDFAKTCRQKNLEADLIMQVLPIPFSSPIYFGTHFTGFDYRAALLVKKVIGLLKSKLHEDYKMEYKSQINKYLKMLHQHSRHVPTVCSLPEKI